MKPMRLLDSFLRIMGGLFCIWLLVIGIVWCWPYGAALVWHLRNGNAAHMGEYQVPIPMWVRPDSENPLRFQLRHGRYDLVELRLVGNVTSVDKWRAQWEANSKSANPEVAEAAKRFLAMKTAKLMIADQPSFCIEDGLTIHCIPDHQDKGLRVEFLGSRNQKPLFYETLGKIRRTTSR